MYLPASDVVNGGTIASIANGVLHVYTTKGNYFKALITDAGGVLSLAKDEDIEYPRSFHPTNA